MYWCQDTTYWMHGLYWALMVGTHLTHKHIDLHGLVWIVCIYLTLTGYSLLRLCQLTMPCIYPTIFLSSSHWTLMIGKYRSPRWCSAVLLWLITLIYTKAYSEIMSINLYPMFLRIMRHPFRDGLLLLNICSM